MSTISPSFNRNAFQAPKAVAFGGAGNATNNARFSGFDVMKGIAPALLNSMSKPPVHTGKLNYFA